MKVALLGTGKTGGKVVEILGETNVVQFNHANPLTIDKLQVCDVAISFLPGPALVENLDILIASGLPLASGSTGFDWPEDIDERLSKTGVAWITASNFSLGMNLIYGMIKILGKAPKLFDEYQFKLHEIHHIHKKDHPSGTALSWQEWLGQQADITSAREGDNPGEHKLTLITPYEDISLEHKSKDRKIFAEGAVWAAKKLTSGELPAGLHNFQDIMEKELSL